MTRTDKPGTSSPSTSSVATSFLDAVAVAALHAANADVLLVDVRTPGEFQTAHIPGSVNLPLDQIDAHLHRIVGQAGGRLVLVCQSGGRAGTACQRLTSAGLANVRVLEGGMTSWVAAGQPVERSGRPRWGLERQARLVAGGIVLLAVVASLWLPGLQFVAGVVGVGLVIGALTDSCLMGMLLAKLPYNQGPKVDVQAAIERLAGPYGKPS